MSYQQTPVSNIVDRYPHEETCDSEYGCNKPDHPKTERGYCDLPTDDGTMPDNVQELRNEVVGHKIVTARKEPVAHSWRGTVDAFVITLDDGTRVIMQDTDDCCAHTDLESFLLDPQAVDHIILGVGTTDGYETWHIYADMGDVLTLKVGWSCGNPFYYGYGFSIRVERIEPGHPDAPKPLDQ